MNETERQAANRRIAELLGYTLAERGGAGFRWFELRAPDGKIVSAPRMYSWHFDGEAASYWQCIPDFLGSVDACLDALPPDMHVTITCEDDDLYWCRLWRDGDEGWCMDGDTRAETLAAALESWLTAAEGREGGR